MKLIVASFVVAISIPVLASVSISREYAFSPQLLLDVEQNLVKAAVRDSKMQEYPLAFTVDQANGIMLWCPPHMPKVDGSGCSLNFLNKMNSVTVNISKGLTLSFTSKQVIDKLNAVDPNVTQEHQHFGSPFEKAESFGSHYFCQPEGAEKAKTWQCYVYVQESFGG